MQESAALALRVRRINTLILIIRAAEGADSNSVQNDHEQTADDDTHTLDMHVRIFSSTPWYLTMFAPSSVHVLAFDPYHGADTARQYAGKYASKPE